MYFNDLIKKWRKRRRDRIYEGPSEDGGARVEIDPRAPKNIVSDRLVRFSCRYSTLSFLEEDTGMKCGEYCVGVSLDGENAVCTIECSDGIDTGKKRTERRSCSFLGEIDEIIKKYKVAEHNGYHNNRNGLPDFYGVTVDAEYAAGERIICSDNEDVFLPVDFLRELCLAFGVKNTSPDGE